MPIWASLGGDERSHLRQHHHQGVLAQVGRFTAHVGAGDQQDVAAIAAGEIRIVGDERHAVTLQRRLHDRMPPALDAERKTRIDDRTHPIELNGEFGEASADIDHRHGFGASGDFGRERDQVLRHGVEQAELDAQGAIGGGGDLRFQFAQLDGRKPHRPRHGLAVDEGFLPRLLQQVLADVLRDFHIIADHVVVLHPQGTTAGLRRVARLKRRDEAARILLQLAQLVEIGVVGRTDESAIALQQRQFVGERGRERVGDVRGQDLQGSRGLREFRRQFASSEKRAQFARGEQAVAHAGRDRAGRRVRGQGARARAQDRASV